MAEAKKILVSGIQPTGVLHIGNYFGAIRQFIELQEKYESYIFIADLHALTTVQNAEELRENTLNIAIDYLAIGLDPEKTTIYKQSDVPEVTELAWIFNCITTVPYLERAHAFKDAEAKGREVNVGTFDYPMLMAADIVIHDANIVPVGQDQKQHIEYARDTVEKFNRIFPSTSSGQVAPTFKMPEGLILENVQTIPGTDGQKMSKSYNNVIGLFASDEEIHKGVMSIKTDSRGVEDPKDPETDAVFAFHRLFSSAEELREIEERYRKGGMGYKESKEILIKNMTNFIKPLRKKREEIAKNKENVLEILTAGGEKARARAEKKMEEVRKAVGLTITTPIHE